MHMDSQSYVVDVVYQRVRSNCRGMHPAKYFETSLFTFNRTTAKESLAISNWPIFFVNKQNGKIQTNVFGVKENKQTAFLTSK